MPKRKDRANPKKAWRLLIFGEGSLRWRNAAKRLAKEATASPNDLEIELYDWKRLAAEHPNFVARHTRLIAHADCGFGYWIWKPYLIREALRANKSAGVVYLDAGSTLNFSNARSRQRWLSYLDFASSDEAMFFQMPHAEATYTKPALLTHLDLPPAQRASGQLEGGHLFFSAGTTSLDFVSSWYELCCYENYRLLDDSGIVPPQVHRHDQSILSCLAKKHSFGKHIAQETYFEPCWRVTGQGFPVWGTRHKTGRSFLKPKREIGGHEVGTPRELVASVAGVARRSLLNSSRALR